MMPGPSRRRRQATRPVVSKFQEREIHPMAAFDLLSSPLLGYIDPGAGSMLLQLLIAGALGGMYTARQYIRQLVKSFARPSVK
jgi:hypothetical protein